MKQKLLVLGAGLYQMPIIAEATAMGITVIAVDGNSAAPGLAHADASRVVDIRDIPGCLAVAREFGVDGIASICVERAVESVAALSAELGLFGISREAALAATDKYVMRRKFADAGIPGPVFRCARALSGARKAAREIGYPIVIKPVDNAGSRGVRKVDGEDLLPAAFELALSQSSKQEVILEEFMDGIEATAESLTSGGETEVLAMSSKIHIPFPACVSIELSYPPHFSAETQDRIKELVIRGVRALGIDRGPTHTEVMVSPRGIKMVEIAARGGGFGVFEQIVPLVSGINIVRETIKIALGMTPDIKPKYSRAAVLRFFNPQEYGIVHNVSGVERAKEVKGIVKVVLDIKPGESLEPITRDGERPGYLISSAETRELALERADIAERKVLFEILADGAHGDKESAIHAGRIQNA